MLFAKTSNVEMPEPKVMILGFTEKPISDFNKAKEIPVELLQATE